MSDVAAPTFSPLAFRSAARTDAGRVRPVNEDRYLERPQAGLWAVADGMGGHEDGEAAAALVVETLGRLVDAGSAYANLRALCASLKAANHALAPGGEAATRGSTVVALLLSDGHYACVWAGDSRCYRLRGKTFEQITRDHTLVQELVEAGALTQDEARRHPRSHVVTRAVGARDEIELDVRHGPVEAGDLFLLCSDGLTSMVADGEIAELIAARGVEAAGDLMTLALNRGARDNVTVVLVAAEQA